MQYDREASQVFMLAALEQEAHKGYTRYVESPLPLQKRILLRFSLEWRVS